jgi:uncharacterized protein (TIGR03067 family)
MRPLLLLVVLLCVAFAPAPFLEKKKPLTDLGRMQGTWVGPDTELRIQGNNYVYYRNGAPSIAYTVALNETTNPRQYNLKGTGKNTFQYSGIYELQGDTLKIASSAGSARPTTFAGSYVRTLTRKKP